MMDQIEKTQKVVEMTGVSYADAKDALERADWDVLSAIVLLEQEGKVERRTAAYSTGHPNVDNGPSDEMLRSQQQWQESSRRSHCSETTSRIWEQVKRFLAVPLIVERNGRQVAVLPMLIVLIILCAFRTIALVAVIASLFFGVRYRFDGLDAVTVDVNDAMDRMADMADSIASGASESPEQDAHDGTGPTKEEPSETMSE